MENLVSVVRATQAFFSVARPGNPYFERGGFVRKTQATWRRGSWGRGSALSDPVEIHSPVNGQIFPARGWSKHTNPISAGNVKG